MHSLKRYGMNAIRNDVHPWSLRWFQLWKFVWKFVGDELIIVRSQIIINPSLAAAQIRDFIEHHVYIDNLKLVQWYTINNRARGTMKDIWMKIMKRKNSDRLHNLRWIFRLGYDQTILEFNSWFLDYFFLMAWELTMLVAPFHNSFVRMSYYFINSG